MKKRILMAAVMTVVASLPALLIAQDAKPPRSLLGFLKPGMNVGIQSLDGTASVMIVIYDEEQFAVANELVKWPTRLRQASELATSHESVRDELDSYLGQLQETYSEAKLDEVQVVPLIRTALAKVLTIGED